MRRLQVPAPVRNSGSRQTFAPTLGLDYVSTSKQLGDAEHIKDLRMPTPRKLGLRTTQSGT